MAQSQDLRAPSQEEAPALSVAPEIANDPAVIVAAPESGRQGHGSDAETAGPSGEGGNMEGVAEAEPATDSRLMELFAQDPLVNPVLKALCESLPKFSSMSSIAASAYYQKGNASCWGATDKKKMRMGLCLLVGERWGL